MTPIPIGSGDIDFFLSGGAGNSLPNSSLGGIRSNTQIVDATLENLFDNVSGQESNDGDIEYRCFYVRNSHPSLTLENAKIWVQTLTPSPNSEVDIGLDPVGVNGTATTIANEQTAPAGVTFTRPVDKAGGLTLGNIPNEQHYAVWIRRTIDPGAAAFNSDGPTLRVEGDTAA